MFIKTSNSHIKSYAFLYSFSFTKVDYVYLIYTNKLINMLMNIWKIFYTRIHYLKVMIRYFSHSKFDFTLWLIKQILNYLINFYKFELSTSQLQFEFIYILVLGSQFNSRWSLLDHNFILIFFSFWSAGFSDEVDFFSLILSSPSYPNFSFKCNCFDL